MQRPAGRYRDVSDEPISAGATSGPASRQPPSATDWLAVKDVVKRLYVINELPLRSVKEILERDYGFRASERMFKDRLKKWGYFKNLTREDWIALAALHTKRKLSGKRSTIFVVRGRQKTLRDLQKYARSQGLTDDELANQEPNIEIPKYLRALTPEKESPTSSSYKDSTSSKGSPETSPDESNRSDDRPPLDATFFLSPPISHDYTPSTYSGSSHFSLSSSLARSTSTMATSMTAEEPALLSAELPMASSWTSQPSSNTSCEKFSQDIEAMSYQIVDPAPLRSRYGNDDIENWILINSPIEGASPDDFSCSCSTCHQPSAMHFPSLHNSIAEQPTRNILNDVEDETFILPTSTKEDGAWKWVALCFLSCINLSKKSDLAERSLREASAEFERLLIKKDRMLLTAAGMMIAILHMHEQGEVATTIMKSAENVVERVLSANDPIRVTIVYLTASADSEGPSLQNSEIASDTLYRVYLQLNTEKGGLHPYTIAALYNYSWLLKWEGKNVEAEKNLRQVYTASCSIFGRNHMQSITTLGSTAGAQAAQGKIEEAIETIKMVIRDCKPTLGKNHPYRLEGKRRLALQYERVGRTPEMEPLYWDVLKGRVMMLGKKHPYTLGSKGAYETLMQDLGKWDVMVKSKVEDLFKDEADARRARSRSASQGSSQCGAY